MSSVQELRKAEYIFQDHALNQKQSLQGGEKSLAALGNKLRRAALQIAGHSVLLVHRPGLQAAPGGLLPRVNLGAGTRPMKATLLSCISPIALQPFPPSGKGSTAFLMTQHRTRFLPPIPRKIGINCSQNHSSYAKHIPWLLLNYS